MTVRRRVVAGVALLLALVVVGPVVHFARTAAADRRGYAAPAAGFVNDASRLNETKVREVVRAVPGDSGEQQIVALVRSAARAGLKISIAGSQHTMGGHTIYPDGIVLDMRPFNQITLAAGDSVLHVGAGARWAEIIPHLNARGRSVAVMQSNNSFTVGGSMSANAHGWQHNHQPLASTVRSFRLLKADGTIMRCSRTENRELFSLVLGGYGLFGVILDADLETVPNQKYRAEHYVMPAAQYTAAFRERVNGPGGRDLGMAYGRLDVTRGGFLKEAILTVFRRVPGADPAQATLDRPGFEGFRRLVFRGSAGSDYGRRLRWMAERGLGETLGGDVWRNQLLNESVDVFGDPPADRTDILEEYFVPPDSLERFLVRMREIVPRHSVDLLNVTIRNVLPDPDAFLRYANREVFGLVMLFSQERTVEADARLRAMSVELIDAVLDAGGTYYLPYRPYATREQFLRAYPRAPEFFALKRKYDPQGLFQNLFYQEYTRP